MGKRTRRHLRRVRYVLYKETLLDFRGVRISRSWLALIVKSWDGGKGQENEQNEQTP